MTSSPVEACCAIWVYVFYVDYVAEPDSGGFAVDLGLTARCFDCMLAGLGPQFPQLCRLVTHSLDLIRTRVDRTAEDLLDPIQFADDKPEGHAGSIPKEFGRWTKAFVGGCKVDPSSFDISDTLIPTGLSIDWLTYISFLLVSWPTLSDRVRTVKAKPLEFGLLIDPLVVLVHQDIAVVTSVQPVPLLHLPSLLGGK